jgi:WD40 repeat protein
MKLQDLVNIFVFLWLNHYIKSLEHEKSFIVQDGFANINTIDIYKNSLLISNSNDVVQRDLDTGEIQRTFRAHENVIYSFVVTKDSRLITSAYDDKIILWSLDTGSILKRIWLRSSEVQIQSIFFENEKLIIGGLDGQIRQLDLVSGRLLKSIGKSSILVLFY